MKTLLIATFFACTQALHLYHQMQASTTGPLPVGSFSAAAGIGDSFFTFGGVVDNFTAGTFTFYNSLWKFKINTLNTGTWQLKQPSGPIPSARAFHSLEKVVDNEGHAYLVLFGGAQYDDFSQVVAEDKFYLYDILANSWEDVSNLGGPSARSLSCGTAKGGKYYVVGGLDAFFQTQQDFWSFDINTRQWTQLADLGGIPRQAAVCGALDNELIVYGGETIVFTEDGVAFLMPNDTWEYKYATGAWSQVNLTPNKDIIPVRNYAATAVSKAGKRLLLYGGDLAGGEDGCGAPFPQNVAEDTYVYHSQLNLWRNPQTLGITPLKRHAAVQVGSFMYVLGGWDFVCNAGVGPGQVWNTKVFATLNL